MKRKRNAKRRDSPAPKSTTNVSYEVVPSGWFPVPRGLDQATFKTKLRAQRQAEALLADEILQRLDLATARISARVVRGGWMGSVNPSTQILFDGDVEMEQVRVYAATLGLIWRQDAVAISRFHSEGKCLVVRLSQATGIPLSGAQIDRFYEMLYESNDAKRATIGFTEFDGAMLFINAPGGLSDKDFADVLTDLAATQLTDEIFLDFARADFELESTDWSQGHGESYRERIRKSGRSDLLDWIDNCARDAAEGFLKQFKGDLPKKKTRKDPAP